VGAELRYKKERRAEPALEVPFNIGMSGVGALDEARRASGSPARRHPWSPRRGL
jgi:hypothetical protein